MEISYGSKPFKEAVEYHRNKVNLPTKRYDDIKHGAFTKAFTSAGAMKEDLLSDLFKTVDDAINKGISIHEFRKHFDTAVLKHGWSYNGSRGWRSELIYKTNIHTSYAAGRYKQMTDPDILETRPYWQYMLGDSVKHRQDHEKYAGIILRYDDPLWSTHYPPNGWGCKCWIRTLSAEDLEREGLTVSKSPKIKIDPKTGEPDGIGKGWGYNVGEAAYGKPVAEKILNEQKGGKWIDVSHLNNGHKSDREKLNAEDIGVAPVDVQFYHDERKIAELISKTINGKETLLNDITGSKVYVSTELLLRHFIEKEQRMNGRQAYLPYLKNLIEDPSEIWVTFAKNELTGKYNIRKRYVKRFFTGEKEKDVVLVTEAVKGIFTSFTFYPSDKVGERIRSGKLLYKKG